MLKQTFAMQASGSHHKVDNVNIDIDSRFLKDTEDTDSISTGSLNSSPEKSFHHHRNQKTHIQHILSKEINQEYHPIRALKDAFIMMLKMKYRTLLDEKTSSEKEDREKIFEKIHEDIDFYCCFIVEGMSIYKSWIIKETKVKETRYSEFAKRIVLESLFEGMNLAEELFPIVKEVCGKDLMTLEEKLPQHIDISKFEIRPELSIEGAFMNSLMLLSDLDRIQSPKMCMESLTLLKNEICYDVDQYHKIFQTSKNFKIDGDNLLSIVCFLICRMKPKIKEIYAQLHLLNIIFGEDASVFFSDGSYMLTTFLAAFEYLISDKFILTL